jgi:hypothetical protein
MKMEKMLEADGVVANAIAAAEKKAERDAVKERTDQEEAPREKAEKERVARIYANAAFEVVCGFRVRLDALIRFEVDVPAAERLGFGEPAGEGFELVGTVEGVRLRAVPGYDTWGMGRGRERIDGFKPPKNWEIQAFIPAKPETKKERKQRKKAKKFKPTGHWRTLEDRADFGTVLLEQNT